MLEPKMLQSEPCVALQIDEEGLTLDVTAKLTEGAFLWTPEQAGEWFQKQWEEARLTLHVSTVARLMNNGGMRQMVRHGEVAWTVAEVPAEQQPQPAVASAPEAAPVEEAHTPALPQEAAVVAPAEVVSQQAPEAPATTTKRASRTRAASEGEGVDDPQEVILTLLIEAGKKGMTTSQLKADTGLNDYQTRKALKDLKEGKRINEKIKGKTATYTSR
jgi:hypothetical protein